MDHDVAAFRAAFQKEAKQTAIAMLDASSVAVDGALRSYGIAGGGFRLTDAAHKVARDPEALDGEVDKWGGPVGMGAVGGGRVPAPPGPPKGPRGPGRRSGGGLKGGWRCGAFRDPW